MLPASTAAKLVGMINLCSLCSTSILTPFPAAAGKQGLNSGSMHRPAGPPTSLHVDFVCRLCSGRPAVLTLLPDIAVTNTPSTICHWKANKTPALQTYLQRCMCGNRVGGKTTESLTSGQHFSEGGNGLGRLALQQQHPRKTIQRPQQSALRVLHEQQQKGPTSRTCCTFCAHRKVFEGRSTALASQTHSTFVGGLNIGACADLPSPLHLFTPGWC